MLSQITYGILIHPMLNKSARMLQLINGIPNRNMLYQNWVGFLGNMEYNQAHSNLE